MKKIRVFLLIITVIFSSWSFAPKANAWLGILDVSSDPFVGPPAIGTWGLEIGTFAERAAKVITTNTTNIIITASKMAALLAVQKITQAIIGKGEGGVILDYNSYMFVAPRQVAMAQMNSFFKSASQNRLSSADYEGMGPNYDAYLVAQARQSIMGQPFATNLQNYATDPKEMFVGGNMKGLMTYMQCANNVACYTLTSRNQYSSKLAMATKVAEMEQTNGFKPVKKNGKIIQPSAIVASALTQIDQLGTQVIMNAEAKTPEALAGAEMQIVAGAGINIAARSLNYSLADADGRAAIRNKNDQFPFSTSYTINGGLGFSAGGITVNTGVGAWTGFLQIGNTCAVGGVEIDAQGVAVVINGVKRKCPYPSANTSKVIAPSVKWTRPTFTCTDTPSCNPGIIPAGTYICNANKECVSP